MRLAKNALILLYAAVVLAVLAPPMLLFEFVIDRHLARCEPHEKFGTYVWHRHSLLFWQWWSTHDDAEKWRMTTRYR